MLEYVKFTIFGITYGMKSFELKEESGRVCYSVFNPRVYEFDAETIVENRLTEIQWASIDRRLVSLLIRLRAKYENKSCLDGKNWEIEYKFRYSEPVISKGHNLYPNIWNKLMDIFANVAPEGRFEDDRL